MIENADGPILDRDVVAAFQQWYLPPDIDMSEPAKLPATLAPANTADPVRPAAGVHLHRRIRPVT